MTATRRTVVQHLRRLHAHGPCQSQQAEHDEKNESSDDHFQKHTGLRKISWTCAD